MKSLESHKCHAVTNMEWLILQIRKFEQENKLSLPIVMNNKHYFDSLTNIF